jgi:putative two-component system response regulator
MQAGETIAISHHEKWDGSGYPHQLAGVAIPLWGRICAIVDVFDALTSRRSYRQAVSDAQAVEIMLPDLGRHFDPQLFGVFMAHLDQILSVAQESRAGARQGPAPPPHLLPSRRERRESDQGPACR